MITVITSQPQQQSITLLLYSFFWSPCSLRNISSLPEQLCNHGSNNLITVYSVPSLCFSFPPVFISSASHLNNPAPPRASSSLFYLTPSLEPLPASCKVILSPCPYNLICPPLHLQKLLIMTSRANLKFTEEKGRKSHVMLAAILRSDL